MDDTLERRPKRSRKDTSYKAKAFEKFKQLKSGSKSKYEIEEVDNVYETVAENDYVKEVLSRQDDDWIVDDDGSGYVEDGRDIFDDDLDSESIAQATKDKKGTKRKKKAVSENAGKGNLQHLLSNLSHKKKEDKKIDDDAILSELLGEIDETPSINVVKSKPIVKTNSVLAQNLAVKDYMKNLSKPLIKPFKKPEPVKDLVMPSTSFSKETPFSKFSTIKDKKTIVQQETLQETVTVVSQDISDSEEQKFTEELSENLNIETDLSEDLLDDIDMTQIEEFESQACKALQEEKVIPDDVQADFMKEWQSFGDDNSFNQNNTISETNVPDNMNIPLIDKKVFRFYWLDAFEDSEKQKGVVFLFGKTYCEQTKSYVGCCVAVRNIERNVYLLPRPYVLDNNNQPTDEPVTYAKIYEEVNSTIMKPLEITGFKSRYVSKCYAFDPEIPRESDYLEIKYPANYPRINLDNLKKEPRTFSRVFGSNSSFLELFLLDRKIKGPCWLDVSNPVPVSNPMSWCKYEVNCAKVADVKIMASERPLPPPPLVVLALNIRTSVNPGTLTNEILMVSCLTQTNYAVDKQAPNPPFQQHFCVFAPPAKKMLPLDMFDSLCKYKATKVQKVDSERALLNYFITQFTKIDPDLIVGHDLQGYQINLLSDRLIQQQNKNFGKLGKLKRGETKRLERTLFLGRLVCDIKISAKELIKSRSYDLDTLCTNVLKIKENTRIELEPEDIPRMFETSEDVLKLISFTMQDTSYILRMMYELNVIPLALQITNIAGNVMSRTLLGGRSERNEFLLLHAFTEKGYLVPDKEFKKSNPEQSTAARKKPTYSGGLVLDPKVGFYDNLVLLMDFNSLYPSIIQEYNICFTTLPISNNEENLVLPDRSLPAGILPTEIRKLVESRRQVKRLMNSSDISNDLRMLYHIRQMALKLTANSMYGCLGFANSRFYAKNLAALVTHKGREILTNTRDLVQKMSFEVVYGDTDSIMINTNSLDYDQVMKIGVKIKQEVNKLYRQVELDIDGVFKYLLLLKKKKYAAVLLSKSKDGQFQMCKEYKGLEIVRRDCSRLASEVGKFILEHILSDQSADDRINNIHTYLEKVRDDLRGNRVPIPLLVITKQLTKDPKKYLDAKALPHVQVALRYNQQCGGHLRSGDTVPYVICEDGTENAATQRAYHVDELKNSEKLKIDVEYYLEKQIFPVVSRICEPIEGTDAYQIGLNLGLNMTNYKPPKTTSETVGENITKPEIKFRNVDKFAFTCPSCEVKHTIDGALVGKIPFLEKCPNVDCNSRPIDYLAYVQNQLELLIRSCIRKYYRGVLTCEDPSCTNDTRRLPLRFAGKHPICPNCEQGVMFRIYTEKDLYTQLCYFQYCFDLTKLSKKPLMEEKIEFGYHSIRELAEKYLNNSGYSVINLTKLFAGFTTRKQAKNKTQTEQVSNSNVQSMESEDFFMGYDEEDEL